MVSFLGPAMPGFALAATPPAADAELIERLDRTDDPPALAIHLTAKGIAAAGTCDGAATIAATVIERSRDIAWAERRMTQEIYGHGRAAAGDIPLPDAVERANPVTIVFADYTDPLLALNNFDAWAFQRAYGALYRRDCPMGHAAPAS